MEKELLNSGKELLLKDLCARLPYGVKISVNNRIEILEGIGILDNVAEYGSYLSSYIEEVKPYLFPLSSMKGRHRAELFNLRINIDEPLQDSLCEIDFYHKNHFDYRGLIPKGLAIDATGLNIY